MPDDILPHEFVVTGSDFVSIDFNPVRPLPGYTRAHRAQLRAGNHVVELHFLNDFSKSVTGHDANWRVTSMVGSVATQATTYSRDYAQATCELGITQTILSHAFPAILRPLGIFRDHRQHSALVFDCSDLRPIVDIDACLINRSPPLQLVTMSIVSQAYRPRSSPLHSTLLLDTAARRVYEIIS
jgi:hypothetical protein